MAAPGAQDIRAAHDLAVRLAREAGALQLRERAGITAHAVKAHANDLVSHVDLASEALIVDGLRAAFPDDGVLGEEGGGVPGTSGRRWIVDPLDGTRNYLSGAGPWSVCIALQDGPGDDDLALAVVHDPVVGETFSAISGEGAFLDGAPVTASDRSRPGQGPGRAQLRPVVHDEAPDGRGRGALLPEVGDIRRLPAALDLAYLACGRLDCAVLAGTKLWDVAAGMLLAREAGVVLGGVDGRPSPALILAAAPGLWEAFSTSDAAEQAVCDATTGPGLLARRSRDGSPRKISLDSRRAVRPAGRRATAALRRSNSTERPRTALRRTALRLRVVTPRTRPTSHPAASRRAPAGRSTATAPRRAPRPAAAPGSPPTFTTHTKPGSRRNASTSPSVSIQAIVPSPSSGRSRRSSSAER